MQSLPTEIFPDRDALGRHVADLAASILRDTIAANGGARLVVATGSSQFEVLEHLVAAPGIDWRAVEGFHLDEYVGLPMTHPASFCGYLKRRFVDRVPLKSFAYLRGDLPPSDVIQDVGTRLLAAPIHLALVGIGENGHLAFNDPPADFQSTEPYKIVQLDEACRRQQVGEGWFENLDTVPRQAISMTIRQIMACQAILCTVPDARKSDAVARTLGDPISPDIPASILRQHPRATLCLDAAAAAKISGKA
ncbi:MAG: glucosamine-6-phosphate deaminase [Planctomycetota bacterium]